MGILYALICADKKETPLDAGLLCCGGFWPGKDHWAFPAVLDRACGPTPAKTSARVLQACGDAGDRAEDQIDEPCLLALRELFLVHLLAQRPEGEHLGDGQRVHVRGADADGLAEHVAVLQRPLVAHDALKLVRSMALENHGECGCAGSLLDKVT